MQMNADKIKARAENVRIGGKGTARRKKKIVHKSAGGDDKKLQAALKKLPLNNISQADEVDVIKKDGTVMVFKGAQINAAYTANMYTVTGRPEIMTLADLMTEFSKTLPEELEKLKQQISEAKIKENPNPVPDDFEAVSAQG